MVTIEGLSSDEEFTLRDMIEEYRNAANVFGGFRSYHEAIAVIREEYLELEQEVFMRDKSPEDMREEALQLAAMAYKFASKLLYDLNVGME